MAESAVELPQSVAQITLGDKRIYLVGAAHVSKQSVEDVRLTIETVRPDAVCIELCRSRYEAMIDKELWKKLSIFKIIRQRKSVFFLSQLIMGAFYRRLGERFGVQPGAEMLEAANQAERIGSELVLADRDIEVTLKRVWGYVGLWCKLKMLVHILASILFSEEIDEELVEKLKSKDQLESVLAEFTERFPQIRKRLIDERDIYLSQKIRDSAGSVIVAVVGAGHVPGIKRYIGQEHDIECLMGIPPRSVWPRVFKWALPAGIIAILVYGFFRAGAAHSVQNLFIWILVNGVLSALGAAAALGHPLTVASAFFGAPVTSLNPMIGAGWVAGLVQAWVRKPTVVDFEALPEATATIRGFWTNAVTKVLLVVCFANLGSAIGTYAALAWIASRTF